MSLVQEKSVFSLKKYDEQPCHARLLRLFGGIVIAAAIISFAAKAVEHSFTEISNHTKIFIIQRTQWKQDATATAQPPDTVDSFYVRFLNARSLQ